MKFLKVILVLMVSLSVAAAFSSADAKGKKKNKMPDLVKSCKKQCPEAKDVTAILECVAVKEKALDAKKFKKTKCYKDYGKYEKMAPKKEEGELQQMQEQPIDTAPPAEAPPAEGENK